MFLNLGKNPKANKTNNDAYVQQAQNIWSMLDDMAASNPKEYKFFDFILCYLFLSLIYNRMKL